MPEIEEFDREDLGLPEGFVFLFVFDYHSVFERKNPLALIEAFEQAFPEDSGTSLVLKSINSEHYPEEHERLMEAAKGRGDIHVIDRYVTAAEKNAISPVATATSRFTVRRASATRSPRPCTWASR